MTKKIKIQKHKDHGYTEEDYKRILDNFKDPIYMQHAIDKVSEKIIDEVGMENINKIMDGENPASN